MNIRIGIATALGAFLALGLLTYIAKRPAIETTAPTSAVGEQDEAPLSPPRSIEGDRGAPPPPTVAPPHVQVQANGAVFGIVTDAITGEAISDARVRAMWEEVETTSDDDGAYRLTMGDTNDEIVVEAEGYAREVVNISDAHAGRVDVQLFAGGAIAGTVVDKDTGEGIEGVIVIAMPIDSAVWAFAAADSSDGDAFGSDTAVDGTFQIESVPEGDYMVGVQVDKSGYIYDATSTISVKVAAESLAKAAFSLERGAQIQGRVVDTEGRPVAGAEVSLARGQTFVPSQSGLDPNMNGSTGTTTDAEGMYLLTGARHGESLNLMAVAKGFAPELSGYFDMPQIGIATAPDIVLEIGRRITGIAQYSDGTPLKNGYVYEYAKDPTNEWYGEGTEIDEYGHFEISDLPTGVYTLELMTPEFDPLIETSEEIRVEVVSGKDTTGIVLTATSLPPTAMAITGIVIDARGNPVEGAQVTANTMIDFEEEDWEDTDEDGRFTVDTQGLSARVEARYEGKMAFADDVQAGNDIRLVLGAASSIAGVVVDAMGAPCVRCSVVLDTIAGDEQASPMAGMFAAMGGMFGQQGGIKTDADGYFRFGDLTPGTYQALASGQNSGHGESQQIVLLPGEQKSGLRITLAPGASVSGRVRDNRGAPVSGASVTLAQGGENDFAGMMGNMMPMGMSGGARAITGEDGTYTIGNVAPGVYNAVATHPKYSKTSSDPFELDSAQQMNSMDIVLNDGGTVRGVLVTNGEVKPHTMITMVGTQGVFTVMTDSEGGFEVGQMPPGRYIAQHVDMGAMIGGDLSAMSQTPTIVEVADGETTEVDFRPPEGAVTMSGVVHGAGGMTTISLRQEGSPDMTQIDPMSMDMALMLQMAEFQVGQAIARPDGTFSLEGVPPGNYIADIVSINFDMSAGLAAFENFDPSDIPTHSVPITVTEDGAYFEFDLNALQEEVAPAP